MQFFLPTVLRPGAPMPPAGTSGLPESLARVVPEELRYWTVKGVEAQKRRSALVSSGFFTQDNVAFVNGELRKVEVTLYDPVLRTYVHGEGSTDGIDEVFNRVMPIRKSLEEERYFLAVVLEPKTAQNPDLQKEFYTAKAVREAMYSFMSYVAQGLSGSQKSGAGLMHARNMLDQPIATNDKLMLVENYCAPVDFEITDPDGNVQRIVKDTWLQGWRAEPDVWAGIKSGTFKGLSIDGNCKKTKYKKVRR